MTAITVSGRYLSRLLEDLCHNRVHVYNLISFYSDPLVTFVDFVINPFGKRWSNDRMDQVADKRSLELEAFFRYWQSIDNLRELAPPLQNCLYGQTFVVGNINRSELLKLDAHLSARDDIGEMRHGYSFYRGH